MWLTWPKAVPRDLARYVIPDLSSIIRLPFSHHDALCQKKYGRIVEGIYKALAERQGSNQIRYAEPKFSDEPRLQHIRTPGEILDTPGEGTCLDLAILFCGLCLSYDLLPLLVKIEGHALAAVSLQHSRGEWDDIPRSERNAFDKGLLSARDSLREWLERKMYVAVECTGFAYTDSPGRVNGMLRFKEAVAVGKEHIMTDHRPFDFALDIAALQHTWKVTPYNPNAADTLAYMQVRTQDDIIPAQAPEPGNAPYKGLDRFEEDDFEFFFGREKLVTALLERLKDSRFLAVLGASGCGKSSLIRAGLIPALKGLISLDDCLALPAGSENWAIQVLTPTAHPLEALAIELTYDSGDAATVELQQAIARDPRALVRSVGRLLERQKSPHLLLVVDQFEEIFALCRDADERQAFIDNLVTAADDKGGKLTVLIALRADFYAQCSQYDGLRSLVSRHQEFVGRMSDEELFSAIVQPAQKEDWKIQEGLPALILQDVGAEPGALPLLSHVLLKTWEARSGRTMTIKGYQAVGELEGAIAQTAETVFTSKLTSEHRSVARHIFIRLTELGQDTQDVRRRATLEELIAPSIDPATIKDVLEILTAERLVTAEEKEGTYTIIHDALLRHWQRLQGWLAEYPRLRRLLDGVAKATRTWIEHDESPEYLDHRGRRLREAEVLLASPDFSLSPDEHRYIEKCQAADRPIEASVADMGWGVIFAHDVDPEVRAAMQELLDFRKDQVSTRNPDYYHELEYGSADRPIESNREFLERYGVGSTRPGPDRMPYYLLIVGDPERIPFTFQYQLDAQYAVGRIYFDRPEDYQQYARSVVQVEKEHFTLPRRACVFAVENGDQATRLATNELTIPLFETLKKQLIDWKVELISGDKATKEHLGNLLGGDDAPALLFTCGHGMSFQDKDNGKLLSDQGALVCRDWQEGNGTTNEHYFAASDLKKDAQLRGMVLFFWGCYGAGTPKFDNFAFMHMDRQRAPQQIAPHAFIARLPMRALCHPNGGALAAIGAVERKWSYSFTGELGERDRQVFENCLRHLMQRYPVGAAMEFFNQRYVALTAELVSHFERSWFGEVDQTDLNALWMATNDARNYIILGDPAVCLPVSDTSESRAETEDSS